ncbi:MAG TPA: 4Fe-4S binding protein [Methanocella sp.]|nr:4Fe-4S binding protein [Methanocella sp.]
MSLRGRLVDIVYGAAYYTALFFLGLSRLPIIGRPFTALGSGARLKVVTIPVGLTLQGTSAILPLDSVTRLVEAASYVAIADTCLCRQSRQCKDYPVTPGCIYLGEGARAIRYNMRSATGEEARAWLEKARSMGLVTNVIWSSVELEALGADASRTVEVCACCPCCCLMFKTRGASKAYMDNILGFGVCRVVDADACARCTNCERACPFKAIRVDPHAGPGVDEARCKGCGRCEAVCRAKVLKVFPIPDKRDLCASSSPSTPNAAEYMERFLAMVR